MTAQHPKIPLKNFRAYPKFRHNLWSTHEDDPDFTYLTLSDALYKVPVSETEQFFHIRSHCTGHNSLESIAVRSGCSIQKVRDSIQSLVDIGALHRSVIPVETIAVEEMTSKLREACAIWADQLQETQLANEIVGGLVPRQVAIGWMFETYHYIKAFPEALRAASKAATVPAVKSLIEEYAKQEQGHEVFMLRVLERMGFSREEIERSIPLVSTRSLDFLMRELFEREPLSVLLVARIIEAADFDEESAATFAQQVALNYGFEEDALEPFVEHVRVDAALRHVTLLDDNIYLLEDLSRIGLHDVVNGLHDLKHAFDLQKLEIKDYYATAGNYIPRQYVDFFAI